MMPHARKRRTGSDVGPWSFDLSHAENQAEKTGRRSECPHDVKGHFFRTADVFFQQNQ